MSIMRGTRAIDLSVCLSAYLCTYLSTHAHTHWPIHPSTYVSTHIPTYLPIHPHICLPTYLSVHFSAYLPACPFLCLPACLTNRWKMLYRKMIIKYETEPRPYPHSVIFPTHSCSQELFTNTGLTSEVYDKKERLRFENFEDFMLSRQSMIIWFHKIPLHFFLRLIKRHIMKADWVVFFMTLQTFLRGV